MSENRPPPDERPTLAKGDPPPSRPHGGPAAGPSPYEQVPHPQPVPGPPPPWGPPGFAGVPPKHPSATTALTLGLVALCGGFMCLAPLAVAPWAWVTGARAVREIDASGGRLSGRGEAQAGYVLGIIGTVLLVLAALFVLLYVVLVVGLFAGFLGIVGSGATSP